MIGRTAVQDRWEYKYLLDPMASLSLRARLLPHVRPDPNAVRAEGMYFVRSLYWDGPRLEAYAAHRAGFPARSKLRFRVYARSRADAHFVSVEIKAKMSGRVRKLSARVEVADAEAFLAKGEWPGHPDGVPGEFARRARAGGMHPLLLIDYWREAYLPRVGGGLRLTFDSRIRAGPARGFFPYGDPEPCPARGVIFEVKTEEHIPFWLHDAIVAEGLVIGSHSKYVSGIESARGKCLEREDDQ